MRRLLRYNLAQRLGKVLPTWLTELLVGIATTAVFVGLRLVGSRWLGDLAPFPMAILAMVLADLIAGWRSGAVSLVLGLGLIWYFLIPPAHSFAVGPLEALGLAVAVTSEIVILLALALYQREVRAGQLERMRRINFLGHALREMDHRTKNNFQIVTSLLTLQANRSASAEVKSALSEAAERLKAVAAVYAALAPSSQGLAAVRLQDQLAEICDQIRRGFLPDGIELEVDLEPMLVPHETAVSIGIIVNELVTNACKHAFGDGSGRITVRAIREGGAARLEVSDDGSGFVPGGRARSGLGTRLVAAFVQRLRGKSELSTSPAGTTHTILIPLHQD